MTAVDDKPTTAAATATKPRASRAGQSRSTGRKQSTAGPAQTFAETRPVDADLMNATVKHVEVDPSVLNVAVQQFAAGVGNVESLALLGQHELIMQLARIAYTRARQTERGENPHGRKA